MTSSDPVLVVGATGITGGAVVPALVSRGATVRGLVRRPEQAEAVRRSGAAEIAVGDLGDPAAVESALSGVGTVFYVAPAFLPGEAETGQAFVAAAVAAGVRRLVFSSVIHPSLSLVNHAAKAPVEAALYDSGLEYTVLQPTLFFQNLAGSWVKTVESGVFAEPWAVSTRFSRVDYRDVAEAAAVALTEDRLLGGTYELAAEGQLDRTDVAALISEVAGRPVRAERIDPAPLDSPPPLRAMFEHYEHHGLVSNAVTLTAVLGREPRSLRSYLTELAQAS